MWKRNCPKCHKELSYINHESWWKAKRKKGICGHCAKSGENHPNYGKRRLEETIQKIRKTQTGKHHSTYTKHLLKAIHAGFSSYRDYKKFYPKKKQYRMNVLEETRKQLKRNPLLPNFEKRGKCGVKGAYQVDHIISIDEGFKKHISPKIIGAYANLRMIPWKENRIKGSRCVTEI